MMNTKNRKAVSLRAAKERKQKKLALGLGALFLVLVVVQGPRTLKMMRGSKSSAPASAPASGTATTPAAAPQTPTGAAPVAATVSSTELPESDVPPRRTRSQLFSFERFESKDPFAQQVSESTAAPVSTAPVQPSAAAPAGTAAAAPVSTVPVHPQPAAAAPAPDSAATGSRAAAAVIEVNGQRQAVDVSQTFPAGSPTFTLVSVKGRVAMIGIAGGSFSSGNRTIALKAGRTLTLMNTSDGQRYELRLLSVR